MTSVIDAKGGAQYRGFNDPGGSERTLIDLPSCPGLGLSSHFDYLGWYGSMAESIYVGEFLARGLQLGEA